MKGAASQAIENFVDDLSLWYVRRSRDREDKNVFLSALHQVLVTLMQVMAPMNPFITEEIYKNLTGTESIHLSAWPEVIELSAPQVKLIEDMKLVRKIVEMGLGERKSASIKVRQPLRGVEVAAPFVISDKQLVQLVKDELNVKEVVFVEGEELKVVLDTKLDDELIEEGKVRDQIRAIQELRKQQAAKLSQHINVTLTEMPKNPDLLAELVRKTLAKEVKLGSELAIELL
jgi:isoleucyl-tRNA synthetase